MVTAGWLSWFVEKICDFFVGMTVLRLMIFVITPPTVSMPSVSGVTSRSRRSCPPSPLKIPACTAAPYATASSGLIPRFGSFPLKKSLMSCCTLGIRVEPPTSTISSIWFFLRPESSITCFTGPSVFLNKSLLISSKRARVSVSEKSTPSKRASISTRPWCVELSARFVFSTSRRSFWMARLSLDMSLPCFFWKIFMKCCITRWSKSSPPRCVSPFVATTSKTPLSIVRSETSNVPPPRSYTRMFFSAFLSRP
mmetsp:Transcript_49404/g.139403  ORF Transcript_49404/g.139403 Transcript_49404/m.139403 type:complete len:253 (-) Transcript_49404:123-881(-)